MPTRVPLLTDVLTAIEPLHPEERRDALDRASRWAWAAYVATGGDTADYWHHLYARAEGARLALLWFAPMR
jgi:hypothetical protein